MQRAVEHCHIELGKIRTGRASTGLVDSVRVDYYGQMVPLSQVASVSTPDATMILIQPWEKKLVPAIDRAIQAANLGMSPSSDGNVIRLPVPPLTEERRRELAKVARKVGEDSKVGVRNARRDAMDLLKKAEKEENMSEDIRKGGESDVQKLTDKYIEELDRMIADREKDIMAV